MRRKFTPISIQKENGVYKCTKEQADRLFTSDQIQEGRAGLEVKGKRPVGEVVLEKDDLLLFVGRRMLSDAEVCGQDESWLEGWVAFGGERYRGYTAEHVLDIGGKRLNAEVIQLQRQSL